MEYFGRLLTIEEMRGFAIHYQPYARQARVRDEKTGLVIFKGTRREVVAFLRSKHIQRSPQPGTNRP